MARPLWQGSISFGLVQIPVGLVRAEDGGEELSFTLLDDKDHSPVGYRHVNKNTGEEVPKERRIKGYEVDKGKYVILTDDDFKRANVKATETIDILSFVDPGEIPVTRFERPYWITPLPRGAKACELLTEALTKTGKVGIATLVLRNRQHLCAVVPHEGSLVLELLRFDDEIGEKPAVSHPKIQAAELDMAVKLVEGMHVPFAELKVKDTYHDDLMKLIEERSAHPEKIPAPAPSKRDDGGEVVDIMSLLKKSVAERGAAKPARKSHRKRA